MTTASGVARLAGHGLAVQLPQRWEGRIYRRAAAGATEAPRTRPELPTAQRAAATLPGRAGWSGEQTFAVMHLANFALPANRGDYGTGAVEIMADRDIFVAVLEFGVDCLGTALYAPQGLPRVRPTSFNPNGLQRRVAGQSGFQHFCSVEGRPLCVYVVLGSHRRAGTLFRDVNVVLDRIEVTPR